MSGIVLLTGATGFVGRVAARRLAATGYQVRAVSRRPDATVPAAAEIRALPDDYASTQAWHTLLEGVEHTVHCAGIAHASAGIGYEAYRLANAAFPGALATAAAARTSGRFVMISSIRAMSAPVSDDILDEASPPHPIDDYGRSKLEGETLVAAAFGSGRYVILRPSLVYGPDPKGNLHLLDRLARLPLPLPFAGLKARRSVLDVKALADAIVHGLGSASVSGTYVACDRDPVSTADILGAMRRGLGRRPGLFSLPAPLLGAAMTAVGRGGDLQRVNRQLVARSERLAGTGWQAPADTLDRIARYAAQERVRT